MKLSYQDLVSEVIANARKDRTRLEKVADSLLTVSNDPDEDVSEGEQKIASAAANAAISEELSKVTDSLTKINQQLVELVKNARRLGSEEEKENGGKLSDSEKEKLYRALEKERDILPQ